MSEQKNPEDGLDPVSGQGVPLDAFADLERAASIDEYDPTILLQLERAVQVLKDHEASVYLEASSAAQAVYDSHASYIATLKSHLYAIMAKALSMGFTTAQLQPALGDLGEEE
ncbi:MAG: hypothetical protein ACTHJ9_14475 [Rhodanobacter sp.]